MEEALRNPLILHQIFKNLDTEFLLSSCRLVNKTWYKEASSFIHNYRECSVDQPWGQHICEFLSHLDQAVGEMTKTGSRIPFNGLTVRASTYAKRNKKTCPYRLHSSSSERMCRNLISHLNLKYLHLNMGRDDKDCPLHQPNAMLVRRKGSQVNSLTLYSVTQC